MTKLAEITEIIDEFIGDLSASHEIALCVMRGMREPTDEMLRAYLTSQQKRACTDTYQDMIDAALGEQ